MVASVRESFGKARSLAKDLGDIGRERAQAVKLQEMGFATIMFTFNACRLLRLLLQAA
jgi:hypothetical protein